MAIMVERMTMPEVPIAAKLPLGSMERAPRAALVVLEVPVAVLTLSTMFEGVVPSANMDVSTIWCMV